MGKYHIHLKASIFHSSKLIKQQLEDKHFILGLDKFTSSCPIGQAKNERAKAKCASDQELT